jgi:ubiquinone/menaquinone biosynthesis C-methylase UbiE
VSEPDQYLQGYRAAEQERLQRQWLELAPDSAWLFERVGLSSGQTVVEVGCGPRGCLDLLAALVGPTGKVIGIELSDEAVSLARKYVDAQGLSNVDVRVGDGRHTGLERNAFDVVTTRLVLVNVPQPDAFVAEAVAIARPGGIVACHEVTWPLHTLDPPLDAWDQLSDIFHVYADRHGQDLYVGRRLTRLLREHGLMDVQANAISHIYPIGHARRTLAVHITENLRDRFIDDGLVEADELDALTSALVHHLDDPNTFVISNLFIQAWGHKPLKPRPATT